MRLLGAAAILRAGVGISRKILRAALSRDDAPGDLCLRRRAQQPHPAPRRGSPPCGSTLRGLSMRSVALCCGVVLCGTASWGCTTAGRSAAWEKGPEEPEAPRRAATPSTVSPAGLRETFDRAEVLWSRRDDEEAVVEAIRLWEAIVAQEPRHARALTRLARAYYFLADAHLEGSVPSGAELERRRVEYHQKGADAGELALMELEPEFARTMRESGDFVEAMAVIRPDAVEAAYWYCSNLGRFSLDGGFRTKLFYKDRVAGAMHRIRELDAPFFQGGADRALGALYAALPAMAGKDLDRSEQHFRAAQALGPGYLGNYLLEAEFLAVQRGERQRYIDLLQAVLAAPVGDDPDTAPENRAAKRAAQRLLAPPEMEARF